MKSKNFFKLLAVLTLLSVVLTACGSAATPETVVETVIAEKEVEVASETVIETVITPCATIYKETRPSKSRGGRPNLILRVTKIV